MMEIALTDDLNVIRSIYGENTGMDRSRMNNLDRVFAEAERAREATPWVGRIEWVRADGQRMIRLVDTRISRARWVTANSGPDYKIPDDAEIA